uniref:Uncharacterized protein n=1 Tax=Leersia perrieri TaxID=77586 RepID=A0A0D9WQL9_9ORYZ
MPVASNGNKDYTIHMYSVVCCGPVVQIFDMKQAKIYINCHSWSFDPQFDADGLALGFSGPLGTSVFSTAFSGDNIVADPLCLRVSNSIAASDDQLASVITVEQPLGN